MKVRLISAIAGALLLSINLLAEEPSREELKSIDESLETVRRVCAATLDTINAELKARYPELVTRRSQGNSKKNDYRNYQWISVKIGKKEYLITANHNNLDFRTGNPHTQFGRIQFLRCAGSNGPHWKDKNGVWRYRWQNEWRKMPKICVWDEDYSSAHVAVLFGEFLRDFGEDVKSVEVTAPVAEDLPLAERKKADEAIASMRPAISSAMYAVFQELRTRHPDWRVRYSKGNSKKNDYRNYIWMTITIGEKMYQIFFCHEDIDLNTGNMHVQFGRVQFWRDIHYEMGPKVEAGPHTKDEGGWRFRYDKAWSDMPRLFLWDEDYSTKRVADLFDQFVVESQGSTGEPVKAEAR